MARNPIRTALLPLDTIGRLTGVFGTCANAHRQLGLQGLVPYTTFYRAMQFLSITPDTQELIESSWDRWRALFLRPEVPVEDELAVNVYNRDEWPEWHPDADVEYRVRTN